MFGSSLHKYKTRPTGLMGTDGRSSVEKYRDEYGTQIHLGLLPPSTANTDGMLILNIIGNATRLCKFCIRFFHHDVQFRAQPPNLALKLPSCSTKLCHRKIRVR